MTPHKHADEIKAAADGAQVQYRLNGTDRWRGWEEKGHFPHFNPHFQWRLKPKPVTVRYRVALMQSPLPEGVYYPKSVQYGTSNVEHTERSMCFVRWLHDGQDVEV
jgi:hypothetical protein